MIFNVNAAAVAALALTMAVHAAPSPVGHVLHDLASFDNDNDARGARGVDCSPLINVSVGHDTHNCDDHSHHDCDDDCHKRPHPEVDCDDNDHKPPHPEVDCDDADHKPPHHKDDCDDNRHCNDCKSEFWHEGSFLRQVVGEVSEVKRGVLRVEHLPEHCSPEEAARKCGPDCNGFVAGWNGDKSYFDLFCLDKAIHGILSEVDVVLSKKRENGWKPQYHYEC
ncbi:hypothetical protein EDD85DRAFT_514190 [Armillaria nabsnona]|nr:hypothetical protein EDD85DRAFT_514190 [Armillaria nabsnona]